MPLPNLSISWLDREGLIWSCWDRPKRWLPMLLNEGGFRFRALSWARASQKARCVMKLSRLQEYIYITKLVHNIDSSN